MRLAAQWACLAALTTGLMLGAASGRLAAQAAPPPGWAWNAVAPAPGPLRVLISYDMEGVSGVDRLEMTACAYPALYAAGQARLAADVNAVIEGLAQAGVSSIEVIDRHGSGCDDDPDLPTARLDSRARMVDERAMALFERVTRGEWDAVVLVGGHASPGRGGFLEHVGSFGFERIINGVSISESEQLGLLFGRIGVPIILASGDDRYGAQLRERMPWVVFVEVKRATSRSSAELRDTQAVRADLVAQTRAAVANRDRARSLAVVQPLSGAYRPVWPQTLEPLAGIPGVEVSAGAIQVTGANLGEINAAINRIANVVASFTTSDIMWEAVARDRNLDRFRDSVFMARWHAGPPKAQRPP